MKYQVRYQLFIDAGGHKPCGNNSLFIAFINDMVCQYLEFIGTPDAEHIRDQDGFTEFITQWVALSV